MSNSLQSHRLPHARLSCLHLLELLKLMSIESRIPSNHLILFYFLLLLPSIFFSIRVFSNGSVLPIRWRKYWNFGFSISPSNAYLGLISCRIYWFNFLAEQGSLRSLLQQHSSKASVLQHSAFWNEKVSANLSLASGIFLFTPTLCSVTSHHPWKLDAASRDYIPIISRILPLFRCDCAHPRPLWPMPSWILAHSTSLPPEAGSYLTAQIEGGSVFIPEFVDAPLAEAEGFANPEYKAVSCRDWERLPLHLLPPPKNIHMSGSSFIDSEWKARLFSEKTSVCDKCKQRLVLFASLQNWHGFLWWFRC